MKCSVSLNFVPDVVLEKKSFLFTIYLIVVYRQHTHGYIAFNYTIMSYPTLPQKRRV